MKRTEEEKFYKIFAYIYSNEFTIEMFRLFFVNKARKCVYVIISVLMNDLIVASSLSFLHADEFKWFIFRMKCDAMTKRACAIETKNRARLI